MLDDVQDFRGLLRILAAAVSCVPGRKGLGGSKLNQQTKRAAGHNSISIDTRFNEEIYNRRHLHSALRYLPPEEFEATQPRAA
jgi:hypothetical protein